MTHLRPWAVAVALGAAVAAVLGCAKADGAPLAVPGPPTVHPAPALALGRPVLTRPASGGVSLSTTTLAPGDTVGWTITWSAPAVTPLPVGYSYGFSTSVAATNGSWSVIYGSTLVGAPPAAGASTTPGPVALKLAAAAWDSVAPTFCVWGIAGARTSSQQCVTWKVYRKLPAPGLPKVDSTGTVTGMLVGPNTATLALASTRDFCAFQVFASGAVTRFSNSSARCDSIYQRTVPAFERSLVTPALQAHTDSLVKTCPTWAWDATALSATPAPCIAALTVTAIRTTGMSPQVRQRFAAWNAAYPHELPLTVDQHGLVTCQHPGIGTVTATIDGIAHAIEMACGWPVPLQLTVGGDAARARTGAVR